MKKYDYTILRGTSTIVSGMTNKESLDDMLAREDWKLDRKFDIQYNNGFSTTYWFKSNEFLVIIREFEGEC